MKKTSIIWIVVIALIAVLGIGTVSTYNGIITAEETVGKAMSDIDTQLQRRSDLIPNLVESVKGYMAHEKDIIDSITQSRENLLHAGSISEKAEADAALSRSLEALFVNVENYPDLKSSENFIALQDELAGTENRIAVARRDYNAAVETYNVKIKRFPGVLIARMMGFEQRQYFEAKAGAEEVPDVSF